MILRRVAAVTALSALVGASTVPAVADPHGRSAARSQSGATLVVSPTRDLPADGATVRVRGRGFDPRVGIYVALCVTPKRGRAPSPCGGGVNVDASDPSSVWISSSPPPYGRDLAKPYRAGGRFSARLEISPMVGDLDCRIVGCSLVSRADHTRPGDRRFDAAVPVTFDG